MTLLQWVDELPAFLLILARVSSFFLTVPFYSYKTIPVQYKILFSILFSWTLVFVVDAESIPIDDAFILLVIKEVMVGLALGFTAMIILSAVQIAGGLIDFQVGFAIANVIDPQTGAQTPMLGQYFYVFVILFLLSVDGHHVLLDGLFYSYQWVGLTDTIWGLGKGETVEFIAKSFSTMFAIAFQLAIPVVATLFLVDVALGITARAVPQLNIFVVGFPLKILVNFLVLIIVFAVFMTAVKGLFEFMFISMRDLLIYMTAE
ncbi:flagellar biosynthetic protein FliR [Bacillus fonticola]|uniref:flagellar biosynthetic protein FliR n=1 Tax=Bacillus fonticola TaxID=2728853 RepID=UPI00147363C3|nr:flagellar biosynthetic protein FliR [Bacillus fonticola]